jgi:hypothetical protein
MSRRVMSVLGITTPSSETYRCYVYKVMDFISDIVRWNILLLLFLCAKKGPVLSAQFAKRPSHRKRP